MTPRDVDTVLTTVLDRDFGLGRCQVGLLTDPCYRTATRVGHTAHYPQTEFVACEHHAREHAKNAVWDDREDLGDEYASEERRATELAEQEGP